MSASLIAEADAVCEATGTRYPAYIFRGLVRRVADGTGVSSVIMYAASGVRSTARAAPGR